ncbi:MAG: endopeptidase La, partial [Mycoplasmataceae bacterium]|nr:endopeptidase La [Mycoplasmataceae bacterium]
NESAKVALGFVKANAEKYHIDPEIFSKIDIHIHVPSGGIPKDGPSAGVTLTTALLSSLKQCPVPTTISMTGEITLRGQVGIIGGVKEKTISAYRGGVREIFIPREDEKFLDDVPSEIKDEITFHLVDIYDDIYNILFKKFDEENKNINQITK